MILAIEFTLGVLYLVVGLSCLLRPDIWLSWMDKLAADGERAALVLGILALAFGAFIVSGHPLYGGWPLLITVIGYLGLVEGIIYLLFPRLFVGLLRWFTENGRGWMRPLGILALVLGALILYVWYIQSLSAQGAFLSNFYPDFRAGFDRNGLPEAAMA